MDRGGIRTIAWFVTAALLLAACGSGNEEPTTPTAPIPTATTSEPAPTDPPTIAEPVTPPPTEQAEPADPFAIPDDPADIDKAYVERVLEELSTGLALAVRATVEDRRVTPRVRRTLAASYRTPDALPGIVQALKRAVRQTPPQRLFNPRARGIDMTVASLLSADDRCIWVRVRQDTSDLVRQDIKPFAAYYQLRSKRADEDPNRRNATPWMIVTEVRPRADGKEYRDPCR